MSLDGHVWWLVSRSAGIVALLAMTASVVLGLALAGRIAGPRVKAFAALHEHLAITALVAIAVHGEALLGDHYLRPGALGISVPFVMGYRPFATGLGIIGGWLAAALGLSFYARKRFGPKRWRQLHRFTTVAWALAVVHSLLAGTDAANAWLRVPVLGSAGVVTALLAVRVLNRRRPSAAGRADRGAQRRGRPRPAVNRTG